MSFDLTWLKDHSHYTAAGLSVNPYFPFATAALIVATPVAPSKPKRI